MKIINVEPRAIPTNHSPKAANTMLIMGCQFNIQSRVHEKSFFKHTNCLNPSISLRIICARASLTSHDAVILDIDGTLWDASQSSADGWNTGLEMLGVDRRISAAGLKRVSGNPYETFIDLLLPGLRSNYPDLLKTLNDCEKATIRRARKILTQIHFGISLISCAACENKSIS